MKKCMILMITTIFICLTTLNSNSINYYDLYFKKDKEIIVSGEYEKIETDKLYYPTIVNIYISKDEEDAISHIIGNEWKEDKLIKHKTETNKNKYNKQCVVYKEIHGRIIKKYEQWEKSEDIVIKIPMSIEYK